jgi:hypothetical protein
VTGHRVEFRECVEAPEDGGLKLKLKPYGYLWLREGRGPESLAGVVD